MITLIRVEGEQVPHCQTGLQSTCMLHPVFKGCSVAQVIQSRSFALPGGKAEELATRFILPLADFFNHGGDTANFLLTGPSTSLENVRSDELILEKQA